MPDPNQPTEPDEVPQAQVPRRELRDPKVLRALSHPVRLRILDELMTVGPATATELSERIGESPANCSWHLRQLAQHGFVEEAGGGTGRQRPWKLVAQSTSLARPDDGEQEPEFATARHTLIDVLMDRELEAWRAWHASRRNEPSQWRDASLVSQSNGIWLTAEELAALGKELTELVERHIMPRVDRVDPANRPAGSRPSRFVAWCIPTGAPHTTT
jgi:DNA-binding transcriptional ArsR family regulator